MNEEDDFSSISGLFECRVKNADNEWLGQLGPIGHVPEVNGAGAQEFPEFRATKHELITLAKYWAEIAIDVEYWWFLYEQVCGSEVRRHSFARARVNRISGLIGEEVDLAIEEVYQSYGARQNNKAWETFLHGSEAERAALQEEIQRSLRNRDGG
jgi:hypothetical protein